MLAMTDTAAEAITALTQQQTAEESGGLRVAVTDVAEGEMQLSLQLSEAPEAGDQVVGTETGAQVFMETRAAEFLDDKVLDVQQDDQGQLNFAVYPQQNAG